MWTPAQQKAFARALEVCAKHDPRIAVLEEISKHSPAIAERVAQLRINCEQLRMIAQTAVAAETTAS